MSSGRFRSRMLSFTISGLALVLAVLVLPLDQRGQSGGAVYFVSLHGDDANPGTAERPWRHIEWAMTRPFLRGGDAIHLRRGVYRPVAEANPGSNSVTDDAAIRPSAGGEPGRPITVMAEPGETVVLSGRFLAEPWEPAGGRTGVYFHDYSSPLTFPFDHPFQVVEDGRLLFRVSTLEGVDQPGRCFVDTGAKRLYARTTDDSAPAAHVMEYGSAITGIEFLGGVGHWRLAGFALTGFKTVGVMVRNGAGHIEIDHLDISYAGAHRPGADLSSGYAIATFDTSGGNYIHHCRLHHTLAEAVHISQTATGGDLYENNDIYEAGGAAWFHETHTGRTLTGPGIIVRGNGMTVRGNRIYGNGYHGLILESDRRGSEGPSSPSQNIIEGNVFAYNGGNGIYGDGKNGAAASRANIIRFNLFDRNNQARAGSDGDGELRLAGNLDDTLVHNNTFYGEKSNGVLLYASSVANGTAQEADAVPDRARIVNNIIVHLGRTPRIYPLRAVDVSPDAVVDYNNWYRPGGGVLVSWNGAQLASLEEFRNKTGQERRGMSLDPRFVSSESGHFWLRAVSPMIGRGLADIPRDGSQDVNLCPGAPPDLGAFPYRPLIGVSATELRFAALAGGRDPPVQVVGIKSAGEKQVAWTARTDGQGWLRLSAAGGETPAGLGISVRAAGLGAGTYSGTLQVAPAIEGEPPLLVRVAVAILASPPRRR